MEHFVPIRRICQLCHGYLRRPVPYFKRFTCQSKQKKGKIIRVKIKEKPEKFKGPEDMKVKNGWIQFVATDSVDKWIKMLAKYTILDLEINEFSLEDIFLHYYEGET